MVRQFQSHPSQVAEKIRDFCQSQRDCGLQPKVASTELPWEIIRSEITTPRAKGVAAATAHKIAKKTGVEVRTDFVHSRTPRFATCNEPLIR
jgi:hypothetical protein